MSLTIWTQCAGSSEARELRLTATRVVEAQFVNATRKLVDSDAEQELLEELIDEAKPQAPGRLKHLHYLLFTPFRYPPLRHGSRFGTRFEPSLWYGSVELRTALAEVAFYRLVFLEGSEAFASRPMGGPILVETELSSFKAAVLAHQGVDLTSPPFSAWEDELRSKTSYRSTQALGREMRSAGIEAFLYRSARDEQRGTNVGLFEPAFAAPEPTIGASLMCRATRQRVEFVERALVGARQRFVFERSQFEVDAMLPRAAV